MDDERMTLDDLQSALYSDFEDAVSFIDGDISPARELASRFYKASPFGDEENGRSQIVMPVVRDTVRSTMPSLMRIFFGGQRVLEFVGTNEVSATLADEMTQTVEYVFTRQNDGWSVCWSAFKDALVRKVGFIKWWWDDSYVVQGKTYDGVTEQELQIMQSELGPDDAMEIVSVDPETMTYVVRVSRQKQNKRVRVMAVPPEEVVIDRFAISDRDFTLFGHRTLKTVGQLRAMGIDIYEDDISSGGEGSTSLSLNPERVERQPNQVFTTEQYETDDQKKVLFCDLFYRCDYDGDGISELNRVLTVGDKLRIVSVEYADEPNIATLCPDPEPHVVFGLSQADNLMDIQLIESHVTRDTLDSLKSSIFPRTAYVEGQVNSDDVLNTEIGAAIRMKQAGMVQPLVTPFVGKEAMPMLDWLDAIKERRTGVRGSSPALDAKALQSTNQVAVNAAVTGAQAQVELIARIFAETGLKRVFRGIAKLVMEHQQGPMEVVIDGEKVQVDPRTWDVEAELVVLTGLGTGQHETQIAALQQVATQQAGTIANLGLDNPLCDFQHLYNTQVKLLQLAGIRDTHRYWKNPERWDPPEPTQPEPTPEQVLAEATMKVEEGKLELEQLKVILQDDRERDKLDAEVLLKAAEIKARYGGQVDVAAINAQIEKARLNAQVKIASMRPQPAAKTPEEGA